MRALIIGPEEQEMLQTLKSYAEAHAFSMDDLLDRCNGAPAPGDIPSFRCEIPVGYRVVFTIEATSNNKTCRIVSISVPTPGKFPSKESCQMIMDHLGFQHEMGSEYSHVAFENDRAIVIAEIIC